MSIALRSVLLHGKSLRTVWTAAAERIYGAMANLIITYWRDLPSQVSVKSGRREEKRMLSAKFQEAIDMAAMRSGASDSDAYLSDWHRGEPSSCGDDLAAEADRAAAEIEAAYDRDRLKAIIANGGRKPQL